MDTQKKEDRVTYFAETDFRNERKKFGIKEKDRTRHMYVIGKTGMGKSTMLENLAIQDIQNGEGIIFIDPHGSAAEKLLNYIPAHRLDDVVYLNPSDLEYPIAFNVLEDVPKDKRNSVASGLMNAFKKIWVDAWSARMEYLLNYTLLALLDVPETTLLSINRLLSDKDYRNYILEQVDDTVVKSFWQNEFIKYNDKYATEAVAPIQNKVGQFISNPLIRNIIGQEDSSIDFRSLMDEKKIVIINLSKGLIGPENMRLLGGMLVTKIYLAAMSRANLTDEEIARMPISHLYVDEFQNFANESFAEILSESRKYKLALVVANQYVEQMTDEVRSAIFGNVGTLVSFRVGAIDAELLEKEFSPYFQAEDLVNLGFTQNYLKLMIDGVTSKPFSSNSLAPLPLPEVTYSIDAKANSRKIYARDRQIVEEQIKTWSEKSFAKKKDKKENKQEVPQKVKEDKNSTEKKIENKNIATTKEPSTSASSNVFSKEELDDTNTYPNIATSVNFGDLIKKAIQNKKDIIAMEEDIKHKQEQAKVGKKKNDKQDGNDIKILIKTEMERLDELRQRRLARDKSKITHNIKITEEEKDDTADILRALLS